jgi:hypothetical protein
MTKDEKYKHRAGYTYSVENIEGHSVALIKVKTSLFDPHGFQNQDAFRHSLNQACCGDTKSANKAE